MSDPADAALDLACADAQNALAQFRGHLNVCPRESACDRCLQHGRDALQALDVAAAALRQMPGVVPP